MPKLYVKKCVSMDPDRYEFITLEQALSDYDTYLTYYIDYAENAVKAGKRPGYQKSFTSWLFIPKYNARQSKMY